MDYRRDGSRVACVRPVPKYSRFAVAVYSCMYAFREEMHEYTVHGKGSQVRVKHGIS